jgi:hypothetical protein
VRWLTALNNPLNKCLLPRDDLAFGDVPLGLREPMMVAGSPMSINS